MRDTASGGGALRVLFLTANPTNTTRLALGVEHREVRERIERSRYREHISLEIRDEVRPRDLQQALLELRPHVVHFSGHGTEHDGIVVSGPDDALQLLGAEVLGKLFRVLKDDVRLVVLNACFSRDQAAAIVEHVDFAIGMKREVGDRAAAEFAAAFYGAIGFGRTVYEAFELGRIQIEASGLADQDVPELFVRSGVDLRDRRLIDSSAAASHADAPPRKARNNLKPRGLFVGREEEIAAVERALAGDSRATITARASIYGFGGVGKTAIAREVAWRALEAGTYPGGVFWVEAEGNPLRALTTLAAALQQAGYGHLALDAPADVLTNATRTVLASMTEPILVVLDNVDQEGWNDLLPGAPLRVLLTTRSAQLGVGATHEVEALGRDAAMRLALELGGDVPAGDSDALERVVVTKLGGLPIAIEVAAKAVKTVGSWRRYEAYLESSESEALRRVLDAPEFKSAMYPRGIFTALTGSIESCSDEARRLFDGALVFAPESVPVAWAAEAAGIERGEFVTMRALAELCDRALVKWTKEPDTLSMHRLVHSCGRGLAGGKPSWNEINRRGALSVRWWLDRTIDAKRAGDVEARRAHVHEALRAADLSTNDPVWFEIADHLGTHLQNRGLYNEARVWLERAVARAESAVGPSHQGLAILLASLGTLFLRTGENANAKLLFERALSISEAALGSNHPSNATRLSDLALALCRLGEVLPARPLFERALTITEAAYGPDDPLVAMRLSDIGKHLLYGLNEPAAALPLLQRTLEIDEVAFGANHISVAQDLGNLANALHNLGRREESRALLRRAVGINFQTSADDPDLPRSLRDLARMVGRLGDPSASRALLNRALELDELARPNHPAVATDLWLLAGALVAHGEGEAARPLLTRAIGILERAVGPDHPETLRARRSLAKLG